MMEQGSGKCLLLITLGVLVGSCHGLLNRCPQNTFFRRFEGMVKNVFQTPKTVTLVKVNSLQSNPVPETLQMKCTEKVTLVDIMDEAADRGFQYGLVAKGGSKAEVTMVGGDFANGGSEYWEVADGYKDITHRVLTEYIPVHGATITFTLKSQGVAPAVPQVTSAVPPVTSAVPAVTSAVPQVTSAAPQVNSTVPAVNSTVPEATSAVPEVNSTVPEVTSVVPNVTSAISP